MSAQGNKYRNRPEEDQSTRRTAEDELMRPDRGNEPEDADQLGSGDRPYGSEPHDRGVGKTGGGAPGGSGTAGSGLENEGTGSLLVNEAGRVAGGGDDQSSGAPRDEQAARNQGSDKDRDDQAGSGSTKGGQAPGVSGQRGMTGGMEKEGEGHSGPIRSGSRRDNPETEQDRATDDKEGESAREGYEDQGGSHDADGTRGESSGSRPGYR